MCSLMFVQENAFSGSFPDAGTGKRVFSADEQAGFRGPTKKTQEVFL